MTVVQTTTPSSPPRRPAPPRDPPWGYLEYFLISQTLLPAILCLPGGQSFRVLVRMGSFLPSLALLAAYWGASTRLRHPAKTWVYVVLGWLALMIFHPTTNTYMAGIAQTALYAACIAPFIWAPVLVRSSQQLERVMWLLLLCSGASATVGILQVYNPQRFMPAEFSRVETETEGRIAALTYVGAGGREIVRPPGLTDTPGAACGAGATAGLLGILIGTGRVGFWKRCIAFGLAFVGATVIYLTMVRASLVVLLGTIGVYVVLTAMQGRSVKASMVVGIALSILLGATVYAFALGGEAVYDKFASLLDEPPTEVYDKSRGAQVRGGLWIVLTEYPLGAGLGRWGMMRNYFGDPGNLNSQEIGCEVQPVAWGLDGGLILIALYVGALCVTMRDEVRLACSNLDARFTHWAAAACAINSGAIALVLSYTPFTSQIGIQFWFLAGVLVGAARCARAEAAAAKQGLAATR